MSDLRNLAAPRVDIESPYIPGDTVEACADCLPWSVRFDYTEDLRSFVVIETHGIGCRIVQDAGLCHDIADEGSYCAICGAY